MLNGAVNGKMLNVRLNAGTIEPEQVPERMYREYLGGYGLGARMIFDRIPAGAERLHRLFLQRPKLGVSPVFL